MDEPAIIHFGGAMQQPSPNAKRFGKGACACIIQWGNQSFTITRYLGDRITPPVCEYSALIVSLQEAKNLGIRRVDVYGQSKLVIGQVLNRFQVRTTHLRPYCYMARSLLGGFVKRSIIWIPRTENVAANAEAAKLIAQLP